MHMYLISSVRTESHNITILYKERKESTAKKQFGIQVH